MHQAITPQPPGDSARESAVGVDKIRRDIPIKIMICRILDALRT